MTHADIAEGFARWIEQRQPDPPTLRRALPFDSQTFVRVMAEVRARGNEGTYTIKAGPFVEMLEFVREFNERQKIESADKTVTPSWIGFQYPLYSVWIDLPTV